MNPSLQLCIAIESSVVELTVVSPLSGMPGSPQSISIIIKITNTLCTLFLVKTDLPVQFGRGADHMAFDKHSLRVAPLSKKPSLQVWVTTDPKVVDVPVVVPLSGIPASPQSITVKPISH